MTRADKRARQKANTRAAREARQTAAKRGQRRKTVIRVVVIAAIVAAVIGVFAILGGDDSEDVATDQTTAPTTEPAPTTSLPELVKTECNDDVPPANPDRPSFTEAPEQTIDPAKTYTATITTSCGTIVAELTGADAPVATNNFVFLAREGFYDGLKWHRVVSDFMIQGGDPLGNGTGGPGYTVAGETPQGAYSFGELAAAKSPDQPAGTMGSQFFVVTGTSGTRLPNEYASFGTVTEGLDVARTLESFAQEGAEGEAPSRDLYIFKIEITEA